MTGLGFLVSRDFYERMTLGNAKADPILLNLSGAVHLIAGMVVLVNHFRWSSVPEAAISILGFAAVAKGSALIVVPEQTLKTPQAVGNVLTGSMVGFLLAGAYFCYIGYRSFIPG